MRPALSFTSVVLVHGRRPRALLSVLTSGSSLTDSGWRQPPESMLPSEGVCDGFSSQILCIGASIYSKLWDRTSPGRVKGLTLRFLATRCCFRLLWSELLGPESFECKHSSVSSDPSQSIVCLGSTYLLFKNRMFREKIYIKPICNSLNCKPACMLLDWNLINHWLYRELINCFAALYSYKSLI